MAAGKTKRKVYFAFGGKGDKPGLDPCVKVGMRRFTKRNSRRKIYTTTDSHWADSIVREQLWLPKKK